MIGWVYRIRHKTKHDIVYYGSSNQKYRNNKLVDGSIVRRKRSKKSRWHGHRSKYKEWLNGDLNAYCTIFTYFEQYGIDSFDFEIMEEIEYKDHVELLCLERSYIENNTCINKIIPYRSQEEMKEIRKEYREGRKEIQKEYMKKWNEKNPDYKKEYGKKYYQDNKEECKQKNKKYREKHREEYIQYNKDYYTQNKKELLQKQSIKGKQKVRCPFCDKELSQSSLSRHKKKYCPNNLN